MCTENGKEEEDRGRRKWWSVTGGVERKGGRKRREKIRVVDVEEVMTKEECDRKEKLKEGEEEERKGLGG